MKNTLLPLLLAAASLLLSGCFNASQDDQAVPWGRPASWENSGPGMGGF